MPSPDNEQTPWRKVWPSRDGSIWYGLSAAEFKVFALEQFARHWAEGKEVAA